jgi:hypothetical protein
MSLYYTAPLYVVVVRDFALSRCRHRGMRDSRPRLRGPGPPGHGHGGAANWQRAPERTPGRAWRCLAQAACAGSGHW